MEVIEHKLDSWYLLSDNDVRYLEVRSGFGGQSFWLLFRLDDVERDGHEVSGKYYIQALAEKVQRQTHQYAGRNEPLEKQREVVEVVTQWRLHSGFKADM